MPKNHPLARILSYIEIEIHINVLVFGFLGLDILKGPCHYIGVNVSFGLGPRFSQILSNIELQT